MKSAIYHKITCLLHVGKNVDKWREMNLDFAPKQFLNCLRPGTRIPTLKEIFYTLYSVSVKRSGSI
jgi:hypothetical protein